MPSGRNLCLHNFRRGAERDSRRAARAEAPNPVLQKVLDQVAATRQ